LLFAVFGGASFVVDVFVAASSASRFFFAIQRRVYSRRWALLHKWLEESEKFEYRGNGSPSNMYDSLEECIGYPNHLGTSGWEDVQLDLLIPIRKKVAQ
jgi:hypothetical protein